MKKILALAALALSFSSCIVVVPDRSAPTTTTTTTTTRPYVVTTPPSNSNIIQEFQPTRGLGSSYRFGETVSFRVTVARTGFVKLVIYNENERPFERTYPVQAGFNLVPNDGSLSAAPPSGVTYVRAFFIPQNNATVYFSGGVGGQYVNTQSGVFLNIYSPDTRDVKDTYLFVTN